MNNTRPYWQHFRQLIFSWQFHWFFLRARIEANFVNPPLYRRLMSIIFTLVLLTAVAITNSWLTFFAAWVFPLTILYHISTLMQLCSEHYWGAVGSNETKSHGRFCGEAPPFGNSFKAWLMWTLRMLFYHLPVRIAVLSDPEICPHDHHHHYPKDDKNWPDAIYNRQEKVDAGANYREFWGIHNAMEAVFQSLANTPPLSEEEIKHLI